MSNTNAKRVSQNEVVREIQKPYIELINIFTDGSFKKTKNGNICGYGIYFPERELNNVSAPFIHGNITNNRAELFAILHAIILVKKVYRFGLINIYTDSV